MKIIQICGTNGTGKTTLVKGLLRGGAFRQICLRIEGKQKELWYDGHVAIIGRYTENKCCGVDTESYTSKQLLKAVDAVLGLYRPLVLLFEDMRFGCLYSFKSRLKEVAEKHKYEYTVVALLASLETISNRVIDRSGNIYVDFDRMMSKQRQCITSAHKIKADGARVVMLDTDMLDESALLSVIKQIIKE